MNRKEKIKDIQSWFKDHVATLQTYTSDDGDGLPITKLTWAKPDTGIFKVVYYIQGNLLMVAGDLGAATYIFSGPISIWTFLSESIDHFAEKCQASECGRDFEDWDKYYAKNTLTYWLESNKSDFEDSDIYDKKKAAFDEAIQHCDCKQSWNQYLEQYGHELYGDCWYEYSDIGMEITMRCLAHREGLEMAAKQLRGKIVVTV